MTGLEVNVGVSNNEMGLPSVSLTETRPGMDSAGAALAAALLQQTKVNMDSQFQEFNFLNVVA
jgi:hypothetical protein